METLWKVVGRKDQNDSSVNAFAKFGDWDKLGILDELAYRLDAVIPTLQQIKPARRKGQYNSSENGWYSLATSQLGFANSWDKLARERTDKPHDALGNWFYFVTFSVHIEQDAFRKLRKKAYCLWGY